MTKFKIVRKFGARGDRPQQLAGPHYAAVDSRNRIFVTDFHHHQVKIYDCAGKFLSQFGAYGSGNGQFVSPTGLAIDGNDRIFVADWGNNRIQAFDTNTSFLGFINSYNSSLFGPQGICTMNSDCVAVADSGNHCLLFFPDKKLGRSFCSFFHADSKSTSPKGVLTKYHPRYLNSSMSQTDEKSESVNISLLRLNNLPSLPVELLDHEIFFNVFSKSTFDSLSAQQKDRLKAFLPQTESNTDFLNNFFDPNSKCGRFCNPLEYFLRKVTAGYYDPEFSTHLNELKKCIRLNHEMKMRDYHAKMLKTLLVRRRQILESAKKSQEDDQINVEPMLDRSLPKRMKIKQRAIKRTKLILKSIKSSVNEYCMSSDDEDLNDATGPDNLINQVLSTYNAKTSNKPYNPEDSQFSTLHNSKFVENACKLKNGKRSASLKVDHPSLDFSDVTMDGLIERAGLINNLSKPAAKKTASNSSSSTAKS
uniref:Uncharacterized protein n=1 Tax=Romanomermis culicivorax TaxID=13658 RepID=A0A915HX74_ROMCU